MDLESIEDIKKLEDKIEKLRKKLPGFDEKEEEYLHWKMCHCMTEIAAIKGYTYMPYPMYWSAHPRKLTKKCIAGHLWGS